LEDGEIGLREDKAPQTGVDWKLKYQNTSKYVRATKNTLQINFTEVKFTRTELRGIWTAWICMTLFVPFIQDLGYGPVDLYSVHVKRMVSDTEVSGRIAYKRVHNIPTIKFLSSGDKACLAEDPSIILHELGHAFLDLFFAGRLNCADKPKELTGVQEGFCDCFATMVLNNHDEKGLRIGQYLPEDTFDNSNNLPRPVNGKPLSEQGAFIAKNPLEQYRVGCQWANFLWDFCDKQVDKKVADAIIVQAHLRPQQAGNGSLELGTPMACYLEALKTASKRQGIDFDWDDLAKKHEIVNQR
jgi:hypothetical protein